MPNNNLSSKPRHILVILILFMLNTGNVALLVIKLVKRCVKHTLVLEIGSNMFTNVYGNKRIRRELWNDYSKGKKFIQLC